MCTMVWVFCSEERNMDSSIVNKCVILFFIKIVRDQVDKTKAHEFCKYINKTLLVQDYLLLNEAITINEVKKIVCGCGDDRFSSPKDFNVVF